MQNVAVFFVTQYNSSLPSFVPYFRALSQVVAEKSLTEKKVYRQTDRQTDKHTYRKGKNYIPPIYFVYLNGVGGRGREKKQNLILVTQYNSSLSSFVPNFSALSQVVAEKSLTEKKVYRQTNRQT